MHQNIQNLVHDNRIREEILKMDWTSILLLSEKSEPTGLEIISKYL